MLIELRQRQTHGPYFVCEPEEADFLSPIFDEQSFDYGCNCDDELSFVPAGKAVYTFGDQDRREIADCLRKLDHEVVLMEPDSPVYHPPVSDLLALPDKWNWPEPHEWELPVRGLTAEHCPSLLRLAEDRDLSEGYICVSRLARWHAWRALALLRYEPAIEPLAQHLDAIDWASFDEEWTMEELQRLFAAFGPIALPALEARLFNKDLREEVRNTAVGCIEAIGKNPDHGPLSVCPLLHRSLERLDVDEIGVNAFIISALTNFLYRESLPAIEAAFAADAVDEIISGDWEEVQMGFGLISPRTRKRSRNKYSPFYHTHSGINASRQPEEAPPSSIVSQPTPPKIGRNEPCPCGSGKKYKKCCG